MLSVQVEEASTLVVLIISSFEFRPASTPSNHTAFRRQLIDKDGGALMPQAPQRVYNQAMRRVQFTRLSITKDSP